MSQMTVDELNLQTEQIMGVLNEQWEKEAAAGEEQLSCFFTAAAYTLGSFVPFSMGPEGFGPMTMKLFDSLTNGIQIGMQAAGVEATMIKIVKE